MRYRISSTGYRKLLVFIWTACNNYAYTDRRAWRNYCCCCIFFIVRKESVFNAEKLYAGICISTSGWWNSQAYRFILKGTFIIELSGALLMMPVFCKDYGLKGIWFAIFHSISAFCNAGFDAVLGDSG